MNKNNILLVSTNVTQHKLTTIDDNLMRIRNPLDKDIQITTQIIFNKFNLKNTSIAYDLINPNLTAATFRYFKKNSRNLIAKFLLIIALILIVKYI